VWFFHPYSSSFGVPVLNLRRPFTNKLNLIGEEPVNKNNEPEYYSVDYSKLSVILLQGLKETMTKLEETTNKLNEQILYTNKLETIINERLNKLENKN
jgi:hypothetical protein